MVGVEGGEVANVDLEDGCEEVADLLLVDELEGVRAQLHFVFDGLVEFVLADFPPMQKSISFENKNGNLFFSIVLLFGERHDLLLYIAENGMMGSGHKAEFGQEGQ
jgi:hypothetical protein